MSLRLTVILGVTLAALFASVGRGTFEYQLVMAVIGTAGLVVLVMARMATSLARRGGLRWLEKLAAAGRLVGVVGLSQFASIGMGFVIHENDKTAARLFCDQAIARLEETRRISGRYPLALDHAVAGAAASRPYLFRRSGLFVSSHNAFVLSFDEADGVIPHIVQYSSRTGKWVYF
jgi:hypothetical protein